MFRFPPALMFAALLPLSLHVVSDATAANVSGDRKSATAPPGSTPDYPYRPVRFIVTFAPGGSDVVARMLGLKLSEKLGQPFVVDNRPGAGSTLGTAIAAKAAADGYTLLFATGSFAVAPGFYKNLPYDPVKDFAAVGSVGSQPFMLVTHPSVPANSVKELIALAKSKPNQLNYASTGTGGIGHLASELFKSMTGVRITHVPYKGTGPAVMAVLAGEVQLMFPNVSGSLQQVRDGKLKALAVASARRSALAPDLPTFAEAGVPGYEAGTWYGVAAPRGTPQSVIGLLNREIVAVLQGNEFRERLAALGIEPVVSTPKEFADFVQAEIAKWARVIKDAGVSLN